MGNKNKLKVRDLIRIKKNGNPYMIDEINMGNVVIRNIYNGQTKIMTKKELNTKIKNGK